MKKLIINTFKKTQHRKNTGYYYLGQLKIQKIFFKIYNILLNNTFQVVSDTHTEQYQLHSETYKCTPTVSVLYHISVDKLRV